MGISKDKMGFLPLTCKNCGKILGVIHLIFNLATANIQTECKDCGVTTKATDIWFEWVGSVK